MNLMWLKNFFTEVFYRITLTGKKDQRIKDKYGK